MFNKILNHYPELGWI